MDYKLTDFQKDALVELGNLGSGKASSTLSDMMGNKVNLTIPFMDLVQVNEVPKLISGPKKLVAGTYSQIIGDVCGGIVIVFPLKSALMMIDLFQKRRPGTTKLLEEKDQETLKEIGNVLSNSYLETFTNFLEVKADYTDLRVISTFGESISDFLMLNTHGEHAILLKTDFSIPSLDINGDFILLLTLNSTDKLLMKMEAWLEKLKNTG